MTLFVSHGAPTLALDPVQGADLRRLGASLPVPSSVLVVSAHWEATPAAIGTLRPRELIYDFYGFPDPLYRLRYEALVASSLAEELTRLVPGLVQQERGWDHGVWVPLLHLFPQADVPVLQLSLPSAWSPRKLFELGRALAPLRERGVLLLASGGMVHNLRALDLGGGAPVPPWALAFESFVREQLDRGELDALIDYRQRAPDLRLAHPTEEHFQPFLVALGAAADGTGKVSYPISGFEYGSLSRLAVQWS